MAKVQISINDELIERIDKVAESLYMSRSGFISNSCVQVLNSYEIVNLMKQMSLTLNKISIDGKLEDEVVKELESYQKVIQLLMGNKA